jgi:glutaredoxin-related protein
MHEEQCAFCGRIGEPGTHGHHVVPRCKKGTVVVQTCGACGSFIHKTWSHNELRDVYNTVEIIQADERFKTFLKWRLKQKSGLKFKTERRNGRDKGKFR